MTKTSKSHPSWAIQHRRPGTELRCIKERYYLYEYKTVYDSTTKRPKKISGPCLGSITAKDGFKPSPKRMVADALTKGTPLITSSPMIREFGNVALVSSNFYHYIERLKKFFPSLWTQLVAIAYCRFVYKCPLKSIPFRLDASFLYEQILMNRFNQKTASGVLNELGKMPERMNDYMRSFIGKDEYLLIDGTHITSHSANITDVRPGYNTKNNYDGQFNLLYIYSASTKMPLFYRLLPGNIRDVKAFKNTLAIAKIKKAVIVADKGFYSKANVQLMSNEKLSFVIPLKRDNQEVDYSKIENNTYKDEAKFFSHQERIVRYMQQKTEQGIIHLFVDDTLQVKEEKDFLIRITNSPENYDHEKYSKKRNKFGTIALLTPNELNDSIDVYQTYKSRMYIETMFDSMKNVLDADKTYMQDRDTLSGWLFINHICLQWYQELYITLKTKGLIKKISVDDCIEHLRDIQKVKINGQWEDNEATKATTKLLDKIGIKV